MVRGSVLAHRDPDTRLEVGVGARAHLGDDLRQVAGEGEGRLVLGGTVMEMLARSVPGVAVGNDAQKSVLRTQD